MPQKVIVGMSGGVDSSVAAYLLKQEGYIVEGLFMKNWEQDDTEDYCPAKEDMQDAMSVCEKLDIPLHICNFSSDYWDNVFAHFLTEYKAGRTPNPDILCNTEIKFKAFLDYALELGADLIATGHYVRNNHDKAHDETYLLKGLDENKDQSYFLHALNQHQISHARFPIGTLEKPTVRQIAEEQGFITAKKKDSTGICFIGERKFKDFLQTYIPAQPGDIETLDGIKIGRHDGLMYYTIGQRQGLGIGGLRDFDETPWFVADKDLQHNILIAVQGTDHPHLFAKGLIAQTPHWINDVQQINNPLRCKAKIRYRQAEQACEVTKLNNGNIQVMFDEAQRAITPGQSVVFYSNDICLGGAIIESQVKSAK